MNHDTQQQQQQAGTQGFHPGTHPASAWTAGMAAAGQPMQQWAEMALRSSAALADLQVETMRHLWQAQARGAAMFGVPDFSQAFGDDERARRPFSAGAEQIIATMRSATGRGAAFGEAASHAAEATGREAAQAAQDLQAATVQAEPAAPAPTIVMPEDRRERDRGRRHA